MQGHLSLTAPLAATWTDQYVCLALPGVALDTPLALTLDGAAIAWQYTGRTRPTGAEVMLRLGFAAPDQTRRLAWTAATASPTDRVPRELDWRAPVTVGHAPCALTLQPPAPVDGGVAGPFAAVAGRPMRSHIRCDAACTGATLRQLADGPVYTELELAYAFADHRHYTLTLRCFRHSGQVAVSERFGLRMGAELRWDWNPDGAFDRMLSHVGPDFEGEPQPVDQALEAVKRLRGLICRLQIPGIGEYFVPTNRYYWALYHGAREADGMLGVLGLDGEHWQQPVANMVQFRDADGALCWTASLASGARQWLLYAGPVERVWTASQRFVFHGLHADWNQCRLDQHLDLQGDAVWDAGCWQADGFWTGADRQAQAARRLAAYPALAAALADPGRWSDTQAAARAICDPTPAAYAAVYTWLDQRFALWVRQFQGWRRGQHDYAKNVIGFTRCLRGLLIAYELLRKEEALSPAQIARLNACFAFAARRITDEGRWPHERTWRHPLHPESARGIYGYNGEHAPDKLVWTNSLPNFQSDPLCALAQLAATFPEHPDADAWLRKALDDIDRQLTHYAGRSGAWIESINYALYTLSYLIITFRSLKYRRGIDYFQDARVRRMVGWLTRFFGPRDVRAGAYSWPPIGNAIMPCAGGEYLLAYAAELLADDPLRDACYGIYQAQAADALHAFQEHVPALLLAAAPVLDRAYPLPGPFSSEHMDELGVAMRHRHLMPDESYLFQKIGWAKDHYEGDETSFNWHCRGVPLAMDYGTYTADAATWAAHNVVEIPDADPLQRGFLAERHFSAAFDYTRCEVPVVLKLLWGRVRSFAEVDGRDGVVDRQETPYYYIGDDNPVGPKTWRLRSLLWLKPDLLLLYDRVYGDVPHRWNLHAVAHAEPSVDPANPRHLQFDGRYSLDLHCYLQHPADPERETAIFTPKGRCTEADNQRIHRQALVRAYNHNDGIYRAALCAADKDATPPSFAPLGEHGIRIDAPDGSQTLAFLHDEPQDIRLPELGIAFRGRVGFIRRLADGSLQAAIIDGDHIAAHGRRFHGRGPWTWNLDQPAAFHLLAGPPRTCRVD